MPARARGYARPPASRDGSGGRSACRSWTCSSTSSGSRGPARHPCHSARTGSGRASRRARHRRPATMRGSGPRRDRVPRRQRRRRAARHRRAAKAVRTVRLGQSATTVTGSGSRPPVTIPPQPTGAFAPPTDGRSEVRIGPDHLHGARGRIRRDGDCAGLEGGLQARPCAGRHRASRRARRSAPRRANAAGPRRPPSPTR